jgi:hypothetical protein
VLVTATLLLAALLTIAAALKFTQPDWIVATYARLGVPVHRLKYLALILLAGVAGLLIGLRWKPLGVAASAALVAYFTLAIAAHLRAGDARSLFRPVAYAVLSVVTLVLFLR